MEKFDMESLILNIFSDAKYHNEPCSTNDECFGHLMLCKEGKCQCAIDAIPQERFVGEKAKQITCDRGIKKQLINY